VFRCAALSYTGHNRNHSHKWAVLRNDSQILQYQSITVRLQGDLGGLKGPKLITELEDIISNIVHDFRMFYDLFQEAVSVRDHTASMEG
jgi:hypothetical protein